MANIGFLGLRRVRVSGNSMEPTFREGDVLLVRWFSEIAPELALSSVVVIEREEMPGIFFIKRIQKSHGGSYNYGTSTVWEIRCFFAIHHDQSLTRRRPKLMGPVVPHAGKLHMEIQCRHMATRNRFEDKQQCWAQQPPTMMTMTVMRMYDVGDDV